MFDPKLFKQMASETIPESQYTQLKPHLDVLSSRYADDEALKNQEAYMEYWFQQDRRSRFDMIRKEFIEHSELNWPSFARERWPGIDICFNLEPKGDSSTERLTRYGWVDDGLPF